MDKNIKNDSIKVDISESKKDNIIDYLGVLKYLGKYQGSPYSTHDSEHDSKYKSTELIEKGRAALEEMKKMADICSEKFGLNKLEKMQWLDGSKKRTRKYLWAQMKSDEFKNSPISISIFVEISPLSNKARYRYSLEIKNIGTDKKQMEKYHTFLDMPLRPNSSLVYVGGSNEIGSVDIIDESVDVIKQRIIDKTYKKVQLSGIKEWTKESTNKDLETAMLEGISELLPYYQFVHETLAHTYWPSLEEYDPNISKEQWLELLHDPEVTHDTNLAMFKMMIELGGESTCANLAKKYGRTYASYNGLGRSFAERVHKKTECKLCNDTDKERFYTIPFVGRVVQENSKQRYSWKIREELKEALEEMDLSKIDISMQMETNMEFNKNMILYGPPGTGKTFNSAAYAVAICDSKSLEELLDYEVVMDRYNELKKEGRIAFTTFHQSYGYEEFIEGIKPVVESMEQQCNIGENVLYKIESGIFKKFCQTAVKPKIRTDEFEIAEDATIWKITVRSDVKEDCFKNNRIRINWSLDDKGAYSFVNYIKSGDIIITTDGSRSIINGIGVASNEEAYSIIEKSDATTRDITWLATDIHEDIKSINSNKMLHRMTVTRVPNMRINDIIELVKIHNIQLSDTIIEKNEKPYVFIIDEINRGNISKIFGELITLIEETKREGMLEAANAILPYSGEQFSVPKNVYIIGTMNTADRSIALIDTALRRRFGFKEMMPESEVLRSIGADKVDELDVAKMLDIINERITFLYDREHTIGHAFFTVLKDDPSIERLQSIFEKSVIPLLQEYFYEDYQKIQLVLGDNDKKDQELKFILDERTIAKNIFKGNMEDIIDLPEKKYSINKKALSNIQSYIEIM